MRFAVLLTFALAGCASRWGDPHAPKTVVADEAGGAVTVNHGARLQIPLVNDPAGAYEWRRVEPQILMVVAEGPSDAEGQYFTPVRSGEEKHLVNRKTLAGSSSTAQRSQKRDFFFVIS